MFVKDAMTKDPYKSNKDTTITKALDIMSVNDFHRLPIVDEDDHLIGLITEGVIRANTPSQATSLSIYELNYLLSKTTVESIMIKDVFTIHPDALIEEAAEIMRNNNIGCLPVIENDKVIGIITSNDIFDAFIKILGGNVKGSRYVINIKEDRVGIMADIARKFSDNDVNITNISTFYGPRGIEIIIISMSLEVEKMKNVLVDSGYNVTSATVHD